MIDYGYGIQLDTVIENELSRMLYWRNDSKIFNWCRQVGLVEEPNQQKWFKRISEDSSVKMYLVKTNHNTSYTNCPIVIGVCGLTSITPVHNTAEFSIYIEPKSQRKGYARAALRTLIRHGFEDFNLNRIWGETFEGNPGIKLYEELGFTKEGTLRQTYYKQGNYINSHIYSILKEDYVGSVVFPNK